MSSQSNRRRFIQSSALAGVGFWVAGGVRAQESTSPNERIRFACIGVGGKGSSDTADAGRHGDVVALCDIDENRLNGMGRKFPKAKKFVDYRKMFDEMSKSIDAVTVSTPDHSHAPASVMAMKLGKHCFTQKPLTHSISEARRMAEVAREMKVATQMGNQGTAKSGLRKAVAIIQARTLGKVTDVHVWSNRPIWPQGGSRPAPSAVPKHVHWDLFLGPAPERPYANGYHPFAWRGWWDFGTGALGDMACHTMNLPYAALDLRNPISVEAQSSGHNKDSFPKWSIIRYEFPATGKRPAVPMTWYDGGKRPSKELLDGKNPAGSGSLIIGEKGKLYAPGDNGDEIELLGDISAPEVKFTRSPGHFTEWTREIKGGPPSMSNFPDYAGPLTETVLLGNLAVWAGVKVKWDADNLKATIVPPDLDPMIRRQYREGYTL